MPFEDDTFAFLAELEANNSKDWFDANRDRYEAVWKTPALDFIAALSQDMSALSPSLKAEARLNGSLRRINRDVRFSKDKSPYSPRLHLVFWHGSHPNRSPGMHFVLNPQGVGFGAGQWAIEPERLKTLRTRIVDNASEFIDALDHAASVGCRLGKPDLARGPKGFEATGRAADFLRYKGFVARTHDEDAPRDVLIGPCAAEWVLGQTNALLPLIRWLAA